MTLCTRAVQAEHQMIAHCHDDEAAQEAHCCLACRSNHCRPSFQPPENCRILTACKAKAKPAWLRLVTSCRAPLRRSSRTDWSSRCAFIA